MGPISRLSKLVKPSSVAAKPTGNDLSNPTPPELRFEDSHTQQEPSGNTRYGSPDCSERDLDVEPPPYSDLLTDREQAPDRSSVSRLQSFIIQRLVSDYGLSSELRIDDTFDHKYYLDLCRRYCMLLGARFDTRNEIVATKQELMSVIFEPAGMLGIPAETMEYFLLSTRIFSRGVSNENCFDDQKVCEFSKEILVRLAVDYTIIIDALATQESNPLWSAPSTCHLRKASLCRKLKDKCLALHQRYYPWMLDLRLISLEQVIKEQKDKEKDNDPACVLVDDGSDTRLDQNYYANIDRDLASLSETPSTTAVVNMDLADESPYNFPATISFSTSFPSFLLPYRLQTSWPLITALSYQAIRPCSALAPPQTSHDLRIEFSSFHLWRFKIMHDPETRFQPEPIEIIFRRGFECGLPNKINVGHMQFENPDGGVPKSIIEDCDFNDSWEWKYVAARLEQRCSGETVLAKQHLGRNDISTRQGLSIHLASPSGYVGSFLENTPANVNLTSQTTGQTQASSRSSNALAPHDSSVLKLGGNNSHMDMEALMIETRTNLVRSSTTSIPSISHINSHDSILVQKEFRDMLFPDLDDLDDRKNLNDLNDFDDLDEMEDLEDLDNYLNSTTRDTTLSPSQRLEQQAQLVCTALKRLTVATAIMEIVVSGGIGIVMWLLAGRS